MTESHAEAESPWGQMGFRADDGRREVLLVRPEPDGTYRVLNVPVWLFGISVGTRVRAREPERGDNSADQRYHKACFLRPWQLKCRSLARLTVPGDHPLLPLGAANPR